MGSESIAHEADEGKRNNNYIVEANKADGGVEFYPFISQDLLNKALNFASAYDNITNDKRNIIIHAILNPNTQATSMAKEGRHNI